MTGLWWSTRESSSRVLRPRGSVVPEPTCTNADCQPLCTGSSAADVESPAAAAVDSRSRHAARWDLQGLLDDGKGQRFCFRQMPSWLYVLALHITEPLVLSWALRAWCAIGAVGLRLLPDGPQGAGLRDREVSCSKNSRWPTAVGGGTRGSTEVLATSWRSSPNDNPRKDRNVRTAMITATIAGALIAAGTASAFGATGYCCEAPRMIQNSVYAIDNVSCRGRPSI